MDANVFTGELYLGGGWKCGVLQRSGGLDLTVSDWNTGVKEEKEKKSYMWTGQPSVSSGTRLHGGELRTKKDYF